MPFGMKDLWRLKMKKLGFRLLLVVLGWRLWALPIP